MDITGEKIVSRIDYLLQSQGLTRQVLADNVGICLSSITNWKNRNSYPAIDTLYYIAKFLGTSMEYLVSGESEITDRQVANMAKYKKLPEQASLSVDIFVDGLFDKYVRNN